MKSIILILTFISFSSVMLFAQADQKSLLKDILLSGEINYRSYGTGDIIGLGGGIELSKDLKSWIGIGINLSYWSNQRLAVAFYDPLLQTHFEFENHINELKISPFVQLIPLNTRYVDFYIQTGLRLGHYHQTHYQGGVRFLMNGTSETVVPYLWDEGDKTLNLGYEIGFALRFTFDRLAIVPNALFSNDVNGHLYSSLNLKLGWVLR